MKDGGQSESERRSGHSQSNLLTAVTVSTGTSCKKMGVLATTVWVITQSLFVAAAATASSSAASDPSLLPVAPLPVAPLPAPHAAAQALDAGRLTVPAPAPPRLPDTFEKLGMMDYEVYESTPFVFHKKKLLMETIALVCPEHMGNWDPRYKSCSSYYRIRDLESGTVLRNLTESCNHVSVAALRFF